MTEPVVLRPHHSLCIQFFEGKGYSPAFVSGMQAVVDMLEKNDPLVTLTKDCDCICRNCPESQNGVCCSDEKVRRIDAACLDAYGLTFGEELRWHELVTAAKKVINCIGKMECICGDCCWQEICLKRRRC